MPHCDSDSLQESTNFGSVLDVVGGIMAVFSLFLMTLEDEKNASLLLRASALVSVNLSSNRFARSLNVTAGLGNSSSSS